MPSPPPPPPPVEVRVLDAVRAVAEAVSAPDVPADQVYRRAVAEYVAERDGCPAVIVSPTPGRPMTARKTLSKRETTVPVTVILVDSQGGRTGVEAKGTPAGGEPAWRLAWAGKLGKALHGELTEVAEAVRVQPDGLTSLDLSAYEAAGLWRAAVSVLVTVREPL